MLQICVYELFCVNKIKSAEKLRPLNQGKSCAAVLETYLILVNYSGIIAVSLHFKLKKSSTPEIELILQNNQCTKNIVIDASVRKHEKKKKKRWCRLM